MEVLSENAFCSREMTREEREKLKCHDAGVDLNNVPVPKDLKDLCQLLHQVFDKDIVNIEYVIKLMANYKSDPKDWRQYAKYEPHKYTRNLIDEGNGKFNILLLVWAESQVSSIHDHSNSNCFMKCLSGELLETKYAWPTMSEDSNGNEEEEEKEKEMVELKRTPLRKNEVCFINDSIGLHRIENPSHTTPGITLHVYIPAYSECHGFDQNTGKTSKCQVTFYSKYGRKVDE